MPKDITDFLEPLDTPKQSRRPTTSIFSISPEKLARKKNTKTDVLVVTPKGDNLRALKISTDNSHYHIAFDIQRLIPGLNKAGTLYERPDYQNPKLRRLNPRTFTQDKETSAWRLGTFVLVLKGANSENRTVRNLYHDEEKWNARSLQHIYRPWGLPDTLPYDDGGVPFKIVFPKSDLSVREGYGRAFEAGEPLLVLTSPGEDADVMLPVIDFEGYRGEIYKLDTIYGYEEVPWNVRVNKSWWQQQIDSFNEEARCWAKSNLVQNIIHLHENPPSMEPKFSKSSTNRKDFDSGTLVPSHKSEAQLSQQDRLLRQSIETDPNNSPRNETRLSSRKERKRKFEIYNDCSEYSPSKE